jgi:hypothetical protein
MDIRNPTNGRTVIEGENLARERELEFWANRPCPISPSHFINALAVAVILIAIGAALYAANAAAGVPA